MAFSPLIRLYWAAVFTGPPAVFYAISHARAASPGASIVEFHSKIVNISSAAHARRGDRRGDRGVLGGTV